MNGISILLYHSVGKVDPRDSLGIRMDEGKFFEQMRVLKESDCKVLIPGEAVSLIAEGREIFQKAVVITFDDGYRDNITVAAPILERFGFLATFFVTTGYIGTLKTSPKREWQRWECMEAADLCELADRGHDIGSHAVTHVDLTLLDKVSRRRELKESKEELESLINRRVNFFSYPYGHFDDDLARFVKEEGYSAAYTIISGLNGRGEDLYRLKRIEVLNSDTIEDFKEKMNEAMTYGV